VGARKAPRHPWTYFGSDSFDSIGKVSMATTIDRLLAVETCWSEPSDFRRLCSDARQRISACEQALARARAEDEKDLARAQQEHRYGRANNPRATVKDYRSSRVAQQLADALEAVQNADREARELLSLWGVLDE